MTECMHLRLIYKLLDILHVSSIVDEVSKPGSKCRVFGVTWSQFIFETEASILAYVQPVDETKDKDKLAHVDDT